MARTLLQLRQEVYRYCQEPMNSTFGETRVGDNSTSPVLTDAAINTALNKRLGEMARTCVPVPGSATITYLANAVSFSVFGLTAGDGGVLWAVRRVNVAGADLRQTSREYADLYDLPAGTPDSWLPLGVSAFALDPTPTVNTACTVTGYETPPDLLTDSATPAWLPGDLDEIPILGAAADLAEKNDTSPKFAALALALRGRYNERRQEAWNRLMATDPDLCKAFFPNAPLGMAGK